MNESREEIVSQLRTLGESLGSVQDKLAGLERGLADAKSEANARIAAIRDFLEGGTLTRLMGPDPAAGAELAQANESIQKLVLGENQERVFEIFLQEAKRFVNRAVLFLRREDVFSPFKSLGFASDDLEGLEIEDPQDAIQRASAQKRIIYRADAVLEAFPWLDSAGPVPETAVCIPFVFHDSVPAVFYGDAPAGIHLDGLELLTHLTTLVLRNAYLELLLSESGVAGVEADSLGAPVAAAAPAPVVEEPPATEVAPPPAPEPPAAKVVPPFASESPVEEPVAEEPVEAPAAVVEESPVGRVEEVSIPEPPAAIPLEEPEPSEIAEVATFEEASSAPWDESSESAVATEPVEESFAVEEATPSIVEEAEPAPFEMEPAGVEEPEKVYDLVEPVAEEERSEPVAEEVEPAEVVVEEPPLPREEWEKVEQEAKRFARLLVSEIKLYNEDAVEQGRDRGDLYARLRRDIDRSREMYEKRAHPAVRSREDFFHAELVRILAQGHEDRLGPDYPGQKLS